MRTISFALSACALFLAWSFPAAGQAEADRAANTVILDVVGVRNLGIETVEVVETDFEETVFAVGRIEAIPSQRGIVSSRIPGRIIDLRVYEGDTVPKGDVVATIESLQPAPPGQAPPSIELTAPLAGLVMESHASIGEPVEATTAILEIIDLSEVYAVARVPEDQAGRLQPGAPARIMVSALPKETFEGEMLRFGTTADPASSTIDAVFLLEDPHGHLRPDMRVEFSIVTGRRENVMAVPKEALQGSQTNRFVFVKDFELEHAFVKAPVQPGARNDRMVEIVSGLFPGDEVVTKGAYPLAFAGGGSLSLKEALDAAHGHEHAEDGSEMTEGEAHDRHGDADHGSAGGAFSESLTLFFAALSAILLVLLVLSLFLGRRPKPAIAASPSDA